MLHALLLYAAAVCGFILGWCARKLSAERTPPSCSCPPQAYVSERGLEELRGGFWCPVYPEPNERHRIPLWHAPPEVRVVPSPLETTAT